MQIKQLKLGIQRFSTMMEMCGPGSIPDANLMSAIFDLVYKRTTIIFTHSYSSSRSIIFVTVDLFTAKHARFGESSFFFGMLSFCSLL